MKTLERRLGLSSVMAISMGAMLGSGLFVLPGLAAVLTGPSVWLAYLVAGLLVVPATLSKAELATAMPTSGGTYVYIDRAFGPLAGTIAGFALWLSLLLKGAFALEGCGAYLDVLVYSTAGAHLPFAPTALVLLVVVVALNVLGVRKVGRVQVWLVSIAIVGLALLAGWGLVSPGLESHEAVLTHGFSGLAGAVAFVYISYAGVTKVAAVAEEVKRPERNLVLGMVLSLAVVAVTYVCVTLAMAWTIPVEQFAGDQHPVYSLAYHLAGPVVGALAAVLGILTLTSMANSGLLSSSRFPFAMSRDHLLPSLLGWVHPRYLTPVPCIAITGVAMAAAILFLDLAVIAKLAGAFMIVAFIAENLTVMLLREGNVQWYQPSYRAPAYPWLQLFGVVSGIWLLWIMGGTAVAALLGMAVPGVMTFFLYGRRRTDRLGVFGRLGPRRDLLGEPPPPQALDEALPAEAAVVVPLWGHERSPETLIEVGAALADGRKVEVLHLTNVPEQVRLDDMLEDDPAVTSLRRRVGAMADARGFDLEFNAVVTRDVVETIHTVTNRMHCEWLVMEWMGRTPLTVTPFNPLGWLVNHLPANFALLKDAGFRYTREILVMPELGPHDSLVVTTADHLATMCGARLTFVRHVPDEVDEIALQTEVDYIEQLAALCESETSTTIVRGKDRVRAVAALTAGYDLLVMGAPARGQALRLRTPVEDRITRKAGCSVLRLKTPRARVHETLPGTLTAAGALDLREYLAPGCLCPRLALDSKKAVFAQIAATFSQSCPHISASDIEEALWEREHTQNTAVGQGVALPHATLVAADGPCLGVFTLERPVAYGDSTDAPVDVLFATIGPPSARAVHLKLLAELARHVLETPLLERLRTARSADEVRAAFDERRDDEGSAKDDQARL